MPSTVIRRFDYDAEREQLRIEFVTGRRYLYAGVPTKVVEDMRKATSKGGFFNRRIRYFYRFEREA